LFKITRKKILNPSVILTEFDAPYIARKALAGQFVILRLNETGERIPLTIAGYDREAGTVTVIFQVAGKTTGMLAGLNEGDFIKDVAGPLGVATHLESGVRRVCVVGGGVGCAIAYPQAKQLHSQGINVDVVAGFRSKDIVILEDEFKACCDNLYICTDDGSYGRQGFVTDMLRELIESGRNYDAVIAIGPVPMMKFVCKVTENYGIKTVVSLNPVMVDGTGMCGGCRVTVGGKVKYACVDGPDFDGHEVDFDGLMLRNSTYQQQEHECKRLSDGLRRGGE